MFWILGIVVVCLALAFLKISLDEKVAARHWRAHREEEQSRQYLAEQQSRLLALQNELAQLNRQLRS